MRKNVLIDMIGQNTAKNTNYIEKCLKQKLRRIKFPKKNLIECISLRRVKLGAPKFAFLQYYNAQK